MDSLTTAATTVAATTPATKMVVNITPESFLAKPSTYKFRVGVEENEVTNFDPTSTQFIDSFRKNPSAKHSEGLNFINPSLIKREYLSIGLSRVIAGIPEMVIRTATPWVLEVPNREGRAVPFGIGNTKIHNFEGILVPPKNMSFNLCLSYLIKAWLTTEEINLNSARIRFHTYDSGYDKNSKQIYRRLVNIYEHTPKKLYCISFLNYLTSNTELHSISNIWINKRSISPSSGVDVSKHLIRGYFNGGINLALAKLSLGPLGVKLSFDGDISVGVKVGEKIFNFPMQNESNSLASIGNFSFTEYTLGHGMASSFYLNRIRSDCPILNIRPERPESTSRRLILPPSNVYNKLPQLLKACVKGIQYYSEGQSFKTTTIPELKQELIENVLLNSTDAGAKLKEEIRKVKLEKTIGPVLEGQNPNFIDITNHLKTKSITDKLVFARSS